MNTPAPTQEPQTQATKSALTRFGWLISLLSGCLMALAFVPYDISFLVWIGFLPILTVLWCGPAKFWRGFRMGWLFGMGWYSVSFWWIHEVGYVFNIPLPLFLGTAFIPLMAVYSCLVGIWGGVAATALRPVLKPFPTTGEAPVEKRKEKWGAWAWEDTFSTVKAATGCAALWVCIEWMRAHGTLGFSWNSLGMGLYHGLSLIQWAEFVGTTALSFVPLFINVILWGAGRRSYIYLKGGAGHYRIWDFYASMVLLCIMFLGGMMLSRVNSPNALLSRESTLALPVLSVQINQEQTERMQMRNNRLGTPTNEQNDRYVEATIRAGKEALRQQCTKAAQNQHHLAFQLNKPSWVIWPESALGIDLLRNTENGTLLQSSNPFNLNSIDTTHFFNEQLPQMRAELMQSFVLFTGVDEHKYVPIGEGQLRRRGMLNSMACIPGDFSSIVTASKQHLMPFGEYIPFAESCEWISNSYAEITGTQVGDGIHPGTGNTPLSVPVPGTNESIGVIPAICYEDTVGAELTKFVRKGPQVIVNISNDAWFRESACGEQQARNAAFRCIELRRPMVRAANKGVTCAIAQNGDFIDTLRTEDGSPHTAGYSYAVLPVDRNAGVTLYAIAGDWAVAVCLLIVIILCAIHIGRRHLQKKAI